MKRARRESQKITLGVALLDRVRGGGVSTSPGHHDPGGASEGVCPMPDDDLRAVVGGGGELMDGRLAMGDLPPPFPATSPDGGACYPSPNMSTPDGPVYVP